MSDYNTHLAYLVSRFPHLPETFILREMIEMERLGWQIDLAPLIFQRQPVLHADSQNWIARCEQQPFMSRSIASANLRRLRQGASSLLRLWVSTVYENRRSPGFAARATMLFPKAVYLAERFLQNGIQHMHAHYATHPALVAWLIHQLSGIPYSITVHAHDIYVDQTMLATKLRSAALIIAISDFNRTFLGKSVGAWVLEKTHVVHCGIWPEMYRGKEQLDVQPGCPGVDRPMEILNIGSLQPYKGQSYLIEACNLLHRRGVPVHCRIIGGGEERASLERQINAAGLSDQIELLGPKSQEDVARILPTVDCYVQPSVITASGKMEGIPVALMEALVCAIPTVATAISGVSELVQDGITGLLVPQRDAAKLAEAIQSIQKDRERSWKMAQAGRDLVMQAFDIHENARQLSDLLRHLDSKG